MIFFCCVLMRVIECRPEPRYNYCCIDQESKSVNEGYSCLFCLSHVPFICTARLVIILPTQSEKTASNWKAFAAEKLK